LNLANIQAWRRHLHAHPETAFEERATAAFVADKLREFGLEVDIGLAGTGVVGILRGDGVDRAIALRADMDALDVTEENEFPYASRYPGKMHACGHDGHTAMLLGAAQQLAERRPPGTVYFIFQPAEENEGGGRRMIEDGLFSRFPVDAVFGMHNRPGLPIGDFALRSGPAMASFDVFDITITGHGTHAARPQAGADPIVAAGHVITSVQSIVSRNIDPVASAVVSITEVKGGATWNVIPSSVRLRGTVRALDVTVQEQIAQRLVALVERVADGLGCEAVVRYERRYPALVNHPRWTELCRRVAAEVAGPANVATDVLPTMGAEDFSFMLQKVPGCYLWIGNGPADGGKILHGPRYDFNDEVLEHGIRYWVALAHAALAQ
jgi:amidohydrolase